MDTSRINFYAFVNTHQRIETSPEGKPFLCNLTEKRACTQSILQVAEEVLFAAKPEQHWKPIQQVN